MKKNDCLETAIQELSDAGIRDVIKAYGGSGHIQLRWSTPRGERMFSLAATPSDSRRAARNVRAGIRRMLMQDDMLPQQEPCLPLAERARIEERIVKHERKIASLRRLLSGS